MRIELGGGFCIRDYEDGDADGLMRHANDRNVSRFLVDRFPFPYGRADAERWLEHAQAENPRVSFAIATSEELIGGIGLELRSDIYRRCASVGYWLGAQYQHQGIATRAVEALTEWAFAEFDLVRLQAGVFSNNPASARVLEKCGYVLEGRMRRSVTKHGETLDELLYAKVIEEDA